MRKNSPRKYFKLKIASNWKKKNRVYYLIIATNIMMSRDENLSYLVEKKRSNQGGHSDFAHHINFCKMRLAEYSMGIK